MSRALAEAETAAQNGEVPIGAVVARADNFDVIATAHNQMETRRDPTAHAEILAIREATQKVGNWRLKDTILCVTLEPCSMCSGAIKLARLPTLIYGAEDPKLGAAGSLYDLLDDPRSGTPPRVIRGVLEARSLELLRRFFEARRTQKS
jgi:tRNA(adenine34) deaminase